MAKRSPASHSVGQSPAPQDAEHKRPVIFHPAQLAARGPGEGLRGSGDQDSNRNKVRKEIGATYLKQTIEPDSNRN